MDVVDNFIVKYREEHDQWNCLRNCAVNICNTGLKQIGVMGLVTSRVKAEDSLMRKLKNRSSFKNYSDENSIMNDQLDFVGLRIALYFPQQKQDVIGMIKSKFHLESVRPFDRDWKPNEPGVHQNLFGQYVADHVWVSLKKEDRQGVGKHAGQKFEIQLRSVLMDAWAGISHDLEYKALSGELTGTELKLLDALKGHVEVGELMLEQLYRVHRKRIETENEPILSSRELGDILVDSVPESQVSNTNIGDLEALLMGLRGIMADTPSMFRGILRKLDLKKNLRTELERFQRNFQEVPTTVAFYLLSELLPDLSTQEAQFREVATTIKRHQNRPWYDSPYWQLLIWLSHELVSLSVESNASLTAPQVRKYAHIWYAEMLFRSQVTTNRFSNDECMIDCLHRTKDGLSPGLELAAELCVLGLAPTLAAYMEEHDDINYEDDRFHVVVNAMQHTYAADSQAWTRAMYDYSVSFQDCAVSDRYKFFGSTKVALWLMSLNEKDLLVSLLEVWPLLIRPSGFGDTGERWDKCIQDIRELAQRHQNEEVIQLLE